jgi:hypothetical protein
MGKLGAALLIGVAAGVLDVVPMALKKLDRYACVSAFLHWLALGVLIAYVQMPLAPWLKGLAVAEISTLSILALVWKSERRSVAPIALTTAVLGALVGVAAARFAV